MFRNLIRSLFGILPYRAVHHSCYSCEMDTVWVIERKLGYKKFQCCLCGLSWENFYVLGERVTKQQQHTLKYISLLLGDGGSNPEDPGW